MTKNDVARVKTIARQLIRDHEESPRKFGYTTGLLDLIEALELDLTLTKFDSTMHDSEDTNATYNRLLSEFCDVLSAWGIDEKTRAKFWDYIVMSDDGALYIHSLYRARLAFNRFINPKYYTDYLNTKCFQESDPRIKYIIYKLMMKI